MDIGNFTVILVGLHPAGQLSWAESGGTHHQEQLFFCRRRGHVAGTLMAADAKGCYGGDHRCPWIQ